MLTTKDFVALAVALRGLDVPEPVLAALVSFCRGPNSQYSESVLREYLGTREMADTILAELRAAIAKGTPGQ